MEKLSDILWYILNNKLIDYKFEISSSISKLARQ